MMRLLQKGSHLTSKRYFGGYVQNHMSHSLCAFNLVGKLGTNAKMILRCGYRSNLNDHPTLANIITYNDICNSSLRSLIDPFLLLSCLR